MPISFDPPDLMPLHAYYCAFCDSEQSTLCEDVQTCKQRRAHQAPADQAARGVLVGIGLGIVLWAVLVLGAHLVGLL